MTSDYFLWQPFEVNLGSADEDEPLGTKEKTWVLGKGTETRWLLKFARVGNGRVMGEDWAEWISARVGRLLGVPCAEVHPARLGERRGIVSKNIVLLERSERLVHGNSLLSEKNPEYDPSATRENPNYSLEGILFALKDIDPPQHWLGPGGNAFDVWAGYLAFDALVAGRDRHHENWGVITTPAGARLAESYDHGNALGFQESPERHHRMCENTEMRQRWLMKGKSHHFPGKPTLVEVAVDALNLAGPGHADWWRHQVMNIDLEEVEAIVSNVPEDIMSEASRRFVLHLLRDNQRRLLDALSVR